MPISDLQEDGVQRAIQSIYRDLEYAKSLIKPPPAKSNPLDKVVSASLQSLRSSGSIRSSSSSIKEGQDGRHSREPSGDHGAISDESWSVVSDSGRDKSISSASRSFAISGQDSDAPSDSDYDSDRKGSKRRSLVGLFGNLTHRLSRDEK